MKSLQCAVAAAAILTVAGMTPALASVLYDGGAPDQGGVILGELPNAVAMNFTVTANSTLTGANWWGGCYLASSGTCGGSAFQLSIYSDNSGPNMVLDFITGIGSANETATGQLIGGSSGWDEYSYSTTFAPFSLTAGTTYWFVIQETDTTDDAGWGAETTSSAPPGEQLYWLNGTWGFFSETLAFELTGTVAATPLPAALPLFATGVGAMGIFGWRRKRKAATSLAGA